MFFRDYKKLVIGIVVLAFVQSIFAYNIERQYYGYVIKVTNETYYNTDKRGSKKFYDTVLIKDEKNSVTYVIYCETKDEALRKYKELITAYPDEDKILSALLPVLDEQTTAYETADNGKWLYCIVGEGVPGIIADTSVRELTVWSFTDELQMMIDRYFKQDPREEDTYDFTYSMYPTNEFENKLDPVLTSGNGCPDVFGLEDAFVRKYVESGLLLDLTDVYNEVKDKLYTYPIEVGTYNGKVYAMSWQVVPGAVFYNRDVAKKYFGTDDPREVQKYLRDWNTFLDTAAMLKEKSNGNCYIVSTVDDLFKPYSASRKDPWVVNDKLVVDPMMEDFMDMCKTLHDRGYEGRASQWSEGWYAGMKGELRDRNGNPKEVLCYFLPDWGLHYVMKTNAPEAAGKWAMCAGPIGYRWGGTWIGAWAKTANPDGAKELIKYLCSDDIFLTEYALDTGDLVINRNVVQTVQKNFSDPYLAGQNQYAEFARNAENVNGKLTQGTDQIIDSLFHEATTAYMYGEKTKAQAIQDFKKQVRSELGISY